MLETIAKFQERAFLALQYSADEEMKKVGYREMLRDDIMAFAIFSTSRTLEGIIVRAREREIDLEHLGKRKPEQV